MNATVSFSPHLVTLNKVKTTEGGHKMEEANDAYKSGSCEKRFKRFAGNIEHFKFCNAKTAEGTDERDEND